MPREPSARSNLLTSAYQSTVFSGLLVEVDAGLGALTGLAAVACVPVGLVAPACLTVGLVLSDFADAATRDVADVVGWVV